MAQKNAQLEQFEAELKEVIEIQVVDMQPGSEAAPDADALEDQEPPATDSSLQALPHAIPPVLNLDDSACHTESGREHLELFAKYRQDEELRVLEKERRRHQDEERLRAQMAEDEVQCLYG